MFSSEDLRRLVANQDVAGCDTFLRDALSEDSVNAVALVRDMLLTLPERDCMLLLRMVNLILDVRPPALVDAVALCMEYRTETEVRLRCAIYLLRFESEAVTSAFRALLDSDDEKPVQIAAGWFGNSSPAIDASPLCRLLNDPRWDMRLRACQYLARKGKVGPQVLSTVEDLARSPYRDQLDEPAIGEFVPAFDFAEFEKDVKQMFDSGLKGF